MREIVEKAKMVFEQFNELFEKELSTAKNYEAAYENAEAKHEKKFGCRRYSYYDSFRLSRKKKLKKCK